MTYRIRWHSADGEKGPPIGEYATRDEAETARLDRVRFEADRLEFGTGKRGVWTPSGELYLDDLDDRFLGSYIIEQDGP